MPVISATKLIESLQGYEPFDGKEASNLRSVLTFALETANPFARSTEHGHITASAWIIDRNVKNSLLIYHRQMDRWLQPGGHIEDGDEDAAAAAQREAFEETGQKPDRVRFSNNHPFDIDVHKIPTNKKAAAHWHFDLRYLFVGDPFKSPSQDAEEKCKWFSLSEMSNPAIDAGFARLLNKTRSLVPPQTDGSRFL